VKRLCLLVVILLSVASPASAQGELEVSVGELLQDAAVIEGGVMVTGELIGDYGFRSDGSMWTQLNDDSYVEEPILDGGELTGANIGVAVRIPGVVAATLDKPGGYRVRGPLVRVIGLWKYHDPDRGGESYIDVSRVEVIEPGRELVEHPDYGVMASGLMLIAAALLLRRGPRRRRR
jgi:hypothetical protein